MIEIFSRNIITLNFTVKDSAGAALSLTDATVTFTGKLGGRDAATVAWQKTCTITSAAGGLCSATLDESDTAVPGKYLTELFIEWGDPVTAQQTAASEDIRIKTTMTPEPDPAP